MSWVLFRLACWSPVFCFACFVASAVVFPQLSADPPKNRRIPALLQVQNVRCVQP